MTWFATGRRGEVAHYSQNQFRNLSNDIVSFSIDDLPTCECLIGDDGASLLPIEAKLTRVWNEVREQRNILLDRWRWTVMPDSPLTSDCQTSFLDYLRQLNRLTVDQHDPRQIVWPEVPVLDYSTK